MLAGGGAADGERLHGPGLHPEQRVVGGFGVGAVPGGGHIGEDEVHFAQDGLFAAADRLRRLGHRIHPERDGAGREHAAGLHVLVEPAGFLVFEGLREVEAFEQVMAGVVAIVKELQQTEGGGGDGEGHPKVRAARAEPVEEHRGAQHERDLHGHVEAHGLGQQPYVEPAGGDDDPDQECGVEHREVGTAGAQDGHEDEQEAERDPAGRAVCGAVADHVGVRESGDDG